jgi:hypothetical protein
MPWVGQDIHRIMLFAPVDPGTRDPGKFGSYVHYFPPSFPGRLVFFFQCGMLSLNLRPLSQKLKFWESPLYLLLYWHILAGAYHEHGEKQGRFDVQRIFGEKGHHIFRKTIRH